MPHQRGPPAKVIHFQTSNPPPAKSNHTWPRLLRLILYSHTWAKVRHLRPGLARSSPQPSKAGIGPSWRPSSRLGPERYGARPSALDRARENWPPTLYVSGQCGRPHSYSLFWLLGQEVTALPPGQVFHEIIQSQQELQEPSVCGCASSLAVGISAPLGLS